MIGLGNTATSSVHRCAAKRRIPYSRQLRTYFFRKSFSIAPDHWFTIPAGRRKDCTLL